MNWSPKDIACLASEMVNANVSAEVAKGCLEDMNITSAQISGAGGNTRYFINVIEYCNARRVITDFLLELHAKGYAFTSSWLTKLGVEPPARKAGKAVPTANFNWTVKDGRTLAKRFVQEGVKKTVLTGALEAIGVTVASISNSDDDTTYYGYIIKHLSSRSILEKWLMELYTEDNLRFVSLWLSKLGVEVGGGDVSSPIENGRGGLNINHGDSNEVSRDLALEKQLHERTKKQLRDANLKVSQLEDERVDLQRKLSQAQSSQENAWKNFREMKEKVEELEGRLDAKERASWTGKGPGYVSHKRHNTGYTEKNPEANEAFSGLSETQLKKIGDLVASNSQGRYEVDMGLSQCNVSSSSIISAGSDFTYAYNCVSHMMSVGLLGDFLTVFAEDGKVFAKELLIQGPPKE